MNNSNADGLIFKTINPFSDMKFVEELWTDLQKRSVHSYFNSWGWVSTWLLSLPSDIRITFHVGYQNQIPVVAFFLGERQKRNYILLPSRVFALNATAYPHYDSLYIEYNTILYDTSALINFDNIMNYLLTLTWNELSLLGMSHKFATDFDLTEDKKRPFYLLRDHDTNSFFVDLQKIRDIDMNFLQLLSSNRRSQIRRSLKQYETSGKIRIQEAASTQEALDLLDKLVQYHQMEWKKKGWAGAFANQYLYQFHKDLIKNRFPKGEIQLLHIYTDQMDIGYIYSFVYKKEILFYQSGFNYQDNNNYRPGLISHYLAILHNAQNGMKTYDFLAGDSTYKRTLATDSIPMYWIKLYKSKWRYILENTVLKIKTKVKSNPFILVAIKKIIAVMVSPE